MMNGGVYSTGKLRLNRRCCLIARGGGLAVPVMVVVVFIFTVQSLLVPWYCLAPDGTGDVSVDKARQLYALGTAARFAAESDNHRARARRTEDGGPQPDGYFNTYPIYLRSDAAPFHSTAHCVGETHQEGTAWMHRSCQYSHLCLDPQSKEFFVVASPVEVELQRRRVASGSYVSTELLLRSSSNGTAVTPAVTTASSYSTPSVALGGINPRWNGSDDFKMGIDKVRWSPRVVHAAPAQYYALDDDVVLVPFHSFAGHNVGHLLWDDFLPIYTLLRIFGFLEDGDSAGRQRPLLLLRVDTLPLLYASCEVRRNKRMGCAKNFEKFLPLMGVDPKSFTTLKQIQLTRSSISGGGAAPSDSAAGGGDDNNRIPAFPICARHAAAGIGMLTDHGLNDHGWEPSPADVVQNVGRGPMLYQFRNHMLRNMNLPVVPLLQSDRQTDQPFHIVLNAHSSRDPERDVDFQQQQQMLSEAFPTVQVSVVRLSDYTLQDQMELISQKTNIFVSTCGGGSMTGFFLPRGASIILYYAEKSGFNFHKYALTGGPAILDWDLFNNLGYIRTHWLPIGTMNTMEGLESLIYLIRHEMDVVSNGQ